MNVSISNYGQTETEQANTMRVDVGPITIWFSYQTPIAFRFNGELVVRKNEWGPTTGKHLNWIDGGDADAKKERVSGAEFQQRLGDILAAFEFVDRAIDPG